MNKSLMETQIINALEKSGVDGSEVVVQNIMHELRHTIIICISPVDFTEPGFRKNLKGEIIDIDIAYERGTERELATTIIDQIFKQEEELYKIKQLEWEESTLGYDTFTPFGRMTVYKSDDKSWTWGYCFDEYYDEETFSCEGPDQGKLLAQEEWNKRITSMLEEAS